MGRTKDRLSSEVKIALGNVAILEILRIRNNLTQVQLRRIFCHVYTRMRSEKNKDFLNFRKMATGK